MADYKTVQDLKEALAAYPDDTLIMMSKDGEGNSYRPLWEVGEATFDKNEWDYPIDEEDVEKYPEQYDQEDLMKVVVLWPSY